MLLILSLYERSIIYSVNGTFEDASSITIQFQWALLRNTRKDIYIDVFTVMLSNCKVKKARFYEFVFTRGGSRIFHE